MRTVSDVLENWGPGKMEGDQRDNGEEAGVVEDENSWLGRWNCQVLCQKQAQREKSDALEERRG